MKKILTIILLIVSLNTYSKGYYYYGFAKGVHLGQAALNNDHPFVGYEKNNLGAITFINSFNRVGLGVYKKFTHRLSDNFCFATKIGMTTGYSEKIDYKGRKYNLSALKFVATGVSILAVPSIEYRVDRETTLDLSVLGNSINLGFSIKF